MYVDTVQRTDRVTSDRIANEAVSWGVSRERAVSTINDILDRAPAAMSAARKQTPHLPRELYATVQRQLSQLRSHQ